MPHKQKGLCFCNFTQIYPTKSYQWKVFSQICNYFFEQKYVDNAAFNNVSRLNLSSRINNTLKSKIKPFPHNLLKVPRHPRNGNGTTFFFDQPLSPNQNKYLYK